MARGASALFCGVVVLCTVSDVRAFGELPQLSGRSRVWNGRRVFLRILDRHPRAEDRIREILELLGLLAPGSWFMNRVTRED